MDKLQKIATEVGVSSNTVLRVLRGENKEVWPSAIRRASEIRQLAQKLAYLPNGSARAMRRGTFNCVALLLSTDRGRSYLPDQLFNQIHDTLDDQGIRLIVSKLDDKKLTSQEVLPSILREWSCDGLLINYTDHVPAEMDRLIGKFHIPSVWINRKQASDCVYYDDFGGAVAATQHLQRLGHRRIAYLDFVAHDQPDTMHYSRVDRYEGYAHAMRQAGLGPFPSERSATTPVADRLEATVAMLSSPDRPTAVISYDAGERLLYAAALAGLRVPQDVSLISFVPRPPSSGPSARGEMFIGRSLSAMRIPAEKAGRQAVQMLLQRVAARGRSLTPSAVSLEFDEGDTCGPCPA